MKQTEQNNKKWIQGAAIALPILLLAGGWMVWRAKHSTLSQAPLNLGKSGEEFSSSPSSSQAIQNTSNTRGADNSSNSGNSQIASNSQNSDHSQNSGSSQIAHGIPSTETKPAIALEAMTDGCFTLTFTHKSLATHSSDDECSHHRNLIKLPRADFHSTSVCIRVNGTPVRHEAVSGKLGEFVIGAVAGPKDVVTARFCVGKAKCSESCPYPKQEAAKKDEFLEAISGGSNEDTGLAQWEASDAQKNGEVNQALDGDLKKAVEEQELASQRTAANNSKLEIFKDWIGGEMTMACGSRQAGEPSRATASVRVADSSPAQKQSRKQ